jgi:aminoglycoside 2'-N-acetyltransferase I
MVISEGLMQTGIQDRLTIISARTKDLDDGIRAAIIQVCIAAHNNPDFLNLFSYLPADGLHVLAYQQNRLVSHAVITTRWLQIGRAPLLKTAYVDALATAPDYQRSRYGSMVMRQVAWLSEGEYEIACLETERVKFFERLGWQEWRGPLAGRGEHGLVATPDQKGIMILRLKNTPPLNLYGLLTIECQKDRIW